MEINYEKIIYEEVVLQLVESRKEQKINQDELADLLGISLSTYASMEQLRSKFSFERMLKVCNYLHVNLMDIYQKVEHKVLGNEKPTQEDKDEIVDIIPISENQGIDAFKEYLSNLATKEEVNELKTMLAEVLKRLPENE